MDITIFLRLITAHLISDFILQTDRINNGKRGYRFQKDGTKVKVTHKVKVYYHVIHSFTHALLSYLLIADWACWLAPAFIFATHLAIDYIKSSYFKESVPAFYADQLLHFAAILLIWMALFDSRHIGYVQMINYFNSSKFWTICVAYLLVLTPTSIFLNLFLKRWSPKMANDTALPNAGKWIGYLERSLILTFILTANMEAIGFLLAAKSIFRFGELNRARDIKLTEYVLIGTLASFGIAIITGVLLFNNL